MSDTPRTMTCGFCGLEFDQASAQSQCGACPSSGKGACAGIHCPRCGYEMPVEPAWLTRVRAWWRRRKDKSEAGR